MYVIRKYYIGDNLFNATPKANDVVLFYQMKSKNLETSARFRSVITEIGIILQVKEIKKETKNHLFAK